MSITERELRKVGFKFGIVKSRKQEKNEESENETNNSRLNRLREAGNPRNERFITSRKNTTLRKKKKAEISKIDSEFLEFYRILIMLERFARSNLFALSKFLKKHDKNLGLHIKNQYMQMVENKGLLSDTWIHNIKKDVEVCRECVFYFSLFYSILTLLLLFLFIHF